MHYGPPGFMSDTLSVDDMKIVDEFMTKFPPKSAGLEAAVPCCRVQEAYDKQHKKIYIRLARGFEPFEEVVVRNLVKLGGKELYGQAPKGSFERRVAQLLKEMGLDKIEI